jgi:flavorubredoxin
MKVLVVYDTVSPQKLTMKVAETIGDVLKTRGIEVDSFFVKNVDLATVKNCDCLVAGSPTMYFRASSGIMQFLNSFQDKEFSGKLAAAFDTQWQGRFYGNATKGIESKLRRLGFEIISPPLIAYVEGKTNQWQLKEGELENTKKYAEDLANKLHP